MSLYGVKAELSFAEKRRLFELNAASASQSKPKADISTDAALATHQLRTEVRKVTGADVSIEDAYEQQQALLSQFEQSRKQSEQDALFARAYMQALEQGLSEENAIAVASLSFS